MLIIYTHDYCPQDHFLARELADKDVEIEWRDVMNGNPAWQEELRAMARAYLSVPTVVFADGTELVERWPKQVLRKLGLEPKKKGILGRLFG